MRTKSSRACRLISVSLISLFILTTFPVADVAFSRDREERTRESSGVRRHDGGDRARQSSRERQYRRGTVSRHRRKIVLRSPRETRHGQVVSKLPRHYRRVWRGKEPYYYSSGVFYRPGPTGFVVVGAPIGAVVVSLPVGYRRVWIDSSWYYVFGGVFYRRVPSGYIVVETPPSVVIEEDVPVLVEPSDMATGKVYVIADVLNVRSGPGLRYPVLYQVHRGYILELHGETTGWFYVELPNGELGWVMNIYTTPLKSPGSG